MDGVLCMRQWERLRNLLARMRDTRAAVAVLRMHGVPECEIARTMGLAPRTVTQWVHDLRAAIALEVPGAAVLMDGRSQGRAARRRPETKAPLDWLAEEFGVAAVGPFSGTVSAGKAGSQPDAEPKGRRWVKAACWRIPAGWAARLAAALGEKEAEAVEGWLSRNEVEAVVLGLEGLTMSEIAEELDVSLSAVNMRLVRARQRLRKIRPDVAARLWFLRGEEPGAGGG